MLRLYCKQHWWLSLSKRCTALLNMSHEQLTHFEKLFSLQMRCAVVLFRALCSTHVWRVWTRWWWWWWIFFFRCDCFLSTQFYVAPKCIHHFILLTMGLCHSHCAKYMPNTLKLTLNSESWCSLPFLILFSFFLFLSFPLSIYVRMHTAGVLLMPYFYNTYFQHLQHNLCLVRAQ